MTWHRAAWPQQKGLWSSTEFLRTIQMVYCRKWAPELGGANPGAWCRTCGQWDGCFHGDPAEWWSRSPPRWSCLEMCLINPGASNVNIAKDRGSRDAVHLLRCGNGYMATLRIEVSRYRVQRGPCIIISVPATGSARFHNVERKRADIQNDLWALYGRQVQRCRQVSEKGGIMLYNNKPSGQTDKHPHRQSPLWWRGICVWCDPGWEKSDKAR